MGFKLKAYVVHDSLADQMWFCHVLRMLLKGNNLEKYSIARKDFLGEAM